MHGQRGGLAQLFCDGAGLDRQQLAIGGEQRGAAMAGDESGEIRQELHVLPV